MTLACIFSGEKKINDIALHEKLTLRIQYCISPNAPNACTVSASLIQKRSLINKSMYKTGVKLLFFGFCKRVFTQNQKGTSLLSYILL